MVTLTAGPTAHALASSARDMDIGYERLWHERPSLTLLRRGAALARQLPLERQVVWSRRTRNAGLWNECPLMATAQDPTIGLPDRATAAGAAWSIARDRRARAILRCLVPGLDGAALTDLGAVMSPTDLADLDKGPFIWSVTPFFNELDMLEARLSEMAHAVDRFVVVEARQTHRGEPKPLYFEQAKARFTAWSTQLDYCVVDLPANADNWGRERFQRDVARSVLTDLGASADDLVLLTDLDEIVSAERVPAVLDATASGPAVLQMTQHWYNLGWREPGQWMHPKAFRFGQVPASITYSEVRHMAFFPVTEAGWHLSWFGRSDQFDYKLRSFAHAEYDTEDRHVPGFQKTLQANGTDIHGRRLLRSPIYFPSSTKALFSLEEQ
ncbi:MAG TPA: hypothetical protein VFN61_06045 [Acidimicrobiales bacterium]|nr:hypothetical protein [Acidimicrobiales bacterium]